MVGYLLIWTSLPINLFIFHSFNVSFLIIYRFTLTTALNSGMQAIGSQDIREVLSSFAGGQEEVGERIRGPVLWV